MFVLYYVFYVNKLIIYIFQLSYFSVFFLQWHFFRGILVKKKRKKKVVAL